MLSLALAAALFVPAAQSGTIFPQTDSVETRMISWPERKRADREMQDAYDAHFQADRRWSAADKAKMTSTLEEIWGLLEDVENKSRASLRLMQNAVDQKVVLGALDPALGRDLKWRLDLVFTVRMYYLYGNMWTRVLSEGFAEFDPTPERLFGARFSIDITDAELKSVTARYDFDPAAYGLPKPPWGGDKAKD